jgi:hypothetical protein
MDQISLILASAPALIPLLQDNPSGSLMFLALVALVLKRRKP